MCILNELPKVWSTEKINLFKVFAKFICDIRNSSQFKRMDFPIWMKTILMSQSESEWLTLTMTPTSGKTEVCIYVINLLQISLYWRDVCLCQWKVIWLWLPDGTKDTTRIIQSCYWIFTGLATATRSYWRFAPIYGGKSSNICLGVW